MVEFSISQDGVEEAIEDARDLELAHGGCAHLREMLQSAATYISVSPMLYSLTAQYHGLGGYSQLKELRNATTTD
jgi:hypothetical protein